MREYLRYFIDGQWVDPVELRVLDAEKPATERVCGRIAIGSSADVDRAVAAARAALPDWSNSSRRERLDLLEALLTQYQRRAADLADAVNIVGHGPVPAPAE